MQDLLIKADSTGLYDLQIDGSDFESADGFETAIPTSYFTDSRAPAVLVPDALARRGWAGNISYIADDRELGGLLWILDQARLTQDTLNLARSYAQESLQYLLDDGIVQGITISVERSGTRAITILTEITTTENTVERYVSLWRSTDFTRIEYES